MRVMMEQRSALLTPPPPPLLLLPLLLLLLLLPSPTPTPTPTPLLPGITGVLCEEQHQQQAVPSSPSSSFKVTFQWKTIDLAWTSDEERQIAINRKDYVEENNAIAGVKFWRDKMYLSIPRWKEGIPATLAVTSASPERDSDGRWITDPKLQPYPSWEMQRAGDCGALQFVQSMEIDPRGRMWVLDTGRTATLLTLRAKTACTPRLVILDLEAQEESARVLRSYGFPEEVASPRTAYLNDIVLDHEGGGFAYITDSDGQDPGVIVYSLANNTSWKIRHDSMRAQSEAVGFVVGKRRITSPIHVDGIALSSVGTVAEGKPGWLYYAPLSSFCLYGLPLGVLRNRTTNVDPFVREIGRKNSQSGGMVVSSDGVLYFGLLADDALAMWDTRTPFSTGLRIVSRDHVHQQWPDSLAFDQRGNLWCVVNALQNYLDNQVNVSVPNYRLVRSPRGGNSYLYYENGTAPEWPNITAGANDIIQTAAGALFPRANALSASLFTLLVAYVVS